MNNEDSALHWISTGDGARVPYAVDGSGKDVLLLLHGGGGSYRDFEHLVPAFTAAGFRVVRPELRPHFFTEMPSGADVSHARIAHDLKEIQSALGVPEVHVAGWSHGGCVALQFVHDFPESIRTLGLFHTFAAYDYGSWTKNLAFKLQNASFGLMKIMPARRRDEWMRQILRKLFLGEAARRASPEACQRYEDAVIRNMHGVNAGRVTESMSNTYRFDARPWLGSMIKPTLVVTAPRDHIPTAFSDELANALPNAELVRWADGDHGILFADPDGFAERYLQFLAKHSGPINDEMAR